MLIKIRKYKKKLIMPFLNHDPLRPYCCYGNLLRHENMPACLSQVMEFFDTLIVVKGGYNDPSKSKC